MGSGVPISLVMRLRVRIPGTNSFRSGIIVAAAGNGEDGLSGDRGDGRVIRDFKNTAYPFFESDTSFLECMFGLFLVVQRFIESRDV